MSKLYMQQHICQKLYGFIFSLTFLLISDPAFSYSFYVDSKECIKTEELANISIRIEKKVYTVDFAASEKEGFLGNTIQPSKIDWQKIDSQVQDSISSGALVGAKIIAEQHLAKARQASNDTLLSSFYFAIAVGHYRQDTELGIQYLDSAITLAKTASHNDLFLRASNAKSTFLKRLGRFEESKQMSLEVYNFQLNNSLYNVFKSARNLSIIYRNLGKYDSALFYIFIADSVANDSPNPYLKYLTVQGAANIYEHMGKYHLSISKNQDLLKLSVTEPNFMNTWLNLGLSYSGLHNLDSALISYENSLSYAVQVGDTIEMANLYGLIADINYKKDDLSLAITNVNMSLYYAEFSQPDDIISSSKLTLASINIAQGDFKEAILSAQEALALSRELSMPQIEIKGLDVLSKAFYGAGKYQLAYKTARLFEKLKSELNDKNRLAKIEELQTRYETELKDKEINDLTTKAAIQELKLQQKNLAIAIGIIVALVLLSAVVIIYKQRITNEKRRTVEMKQKLLRSQLNPHFIFNALSAIQQFIYQKRNPIETGDYLGRFSQLTRMILNNSEKDMISLSEEISFLNTYLELQKLRFDEPFMYQIKADKNLDVDEILIPPMFTQPFIENSIEHGILHKQEKGSIEVLFKEQNGLLEITLEDNGVGRERAAFIERNQKHRSMATKITMERLKSLQKVFRKRASLAINDLTDKSENVVGTKVVFNLPLVFLN